MQSLVLCTVTDTHTHSSGRYRNTAPKGHDSFLQELSLSPAYIDEIDVKGKFMWWRLKVGEKTWWLWTTYGMTGGWRIFTDETPAQIPHLAYSILLKRPRDKPLWLGFVDPRHFGTIRWTDDEELHKKKLASLGPDMLKANLKLEDFMARMTKGKRADKTLVELLMNQSIISGVGNYLKSETLYHARLSPHRKARSLNKEEWTMLWIAARYTIYESYRLQGATLRDYADANGKTGNASDFFAVYQKWMSPEGMPIIREETLDGRATWWSPSEQK